MSNNLKKQDAAELLCLNNVKAIFAKNDCFGMSDDNVEVFKDYLYGAKPSIQSTKFPDFFFQSGIIEHFAVTSSFESRKKGFKQLAGSIRFHENSKTNFLKAIEKEDAPEKATYRFRRNFDTHSLNYIRQSIQKNWEKHIRSLEKFSANKQIVVFLIEYVDYHLQTAEIVNGVLDTVHNSYRITLDQYMLDWIYQYKEKVDYVILYNPESIEIIKVDQISSLPRQLTPIVCAPVFGIETSTYINTRIYY